MWCIHKVVHTYVRCCVRVAASSAMYAASVRGCGGHQFPFSQGNSYSPQEGTIARAVYIATTIAMPVLLEIYPYIYIYTNMYIYTSLSHSLSTYIHIVFVPPSVSRSIVQISQSCRLESSSLATWTPPHTMLLPGLTPLRDQTH